MATPPPCRRRQDERGSSLVEYCLLVALIALVAVGGVVAFGEARDQMFHRSASAIEGL
jgi:Flp pilus assembly pilin Flp